MSIIFLILGVILLIFSIKTFMKNKSLKDITFFKSLSQSEFTFTISGNQKRQDYAMCFVGGKGILPNKSFKIDLEDDKGLSIPVIKEKINYSFLYKGTFATEAYSFVGNPGTYTLRFENLNNLKVTRSQLRIKQMLENPLDNSKIGLLIRERISSKEKLFMIVGIVFGIILIQIGLISYLKK